VERTINSIKARLFGGTAAIATTALAIYAVAPPFHIPN
jgi:hypothetical protein